MKFFRDTLESISYKNIMSSNFYLHNFLRFFLLLCISFRTSHGFCPQKCFCDDDSLVVQCTNASLEVIPFLLNPQTSSLLLPCNKIKALDQSLVVYPHLLNVDLSYNLIEYLSAADFEEQRALEVLNLDTNRLNSISNNIFDALVNLKELYLNNNMISVIDPHSFENNFDLRILDLSNNKLKTLSDITFGETSNMDSLKLSFNYLTFIPTNALENIRSLKRLDLTGNLISNIPENSFQSLRNLTDLQMDKNNITSLYPQSFAGLQNLNALSIRDNRLTIITNIHLKPLVHLEYLDLSGNLFEEIHANSFPSLPYLKHLRLSRSPRLRRIDSSAFRNVRALQTIKLNHNAVLNYLGDSTFSSLEELTDLDLTACGLVYVSPEQMPSSQKMTLHLAGNPLHCNCSLLWLATLSFNDSFYFDTPTCATPAELYGIPVNKVNLRAAGCPQHLGVAAIGTCIGIILVSLLAAAVFLAWRWRRRGPSTTKTLPDVETGIRNTWPPTQDGHIEIQKTPIYAPKYCVPVIPTTTCGHPQCQLSCQQTLPPLPYSFHPATRPLLTPPSPSVNSQTPLPIDCYYPSPYDDDTHWYSTIGQDGREYLTGEFRKERPSPPNIPPDSPPSTPHDSSDEIKKQRPSPPPIPCNSPHLKPSNSFRNVNIKRQHSNSGRRTPLTAKRSAALYKLQGGASLGDINRHPMTYI